PSGVPFFSTVEGTWLDTTTLDAAYWYRNLHQPVRFSDAVQALADDGHRVFVEVSPHPTLVPAIEDTTEDTAEDVTAIGSLRRGDNDTRRFLTALAHTHTTGIGTPTTWHHHYTHHHTHPHPHTHLDLPTYPFQHQHYWLESSQPGAGSGSGAGAGSGAGSGRAGTAGGTAEVESRFWDAVARQDLETVATTLAVPPSAGLDTVVPALSAWHRHQHDQARINTWTYQETWKPLTLPTTHQPHQTWLIAIPETQTHHPHITNILTNLHHHGITPIPLTLNHTHTNPQHLHHTLHHTRQQAQNHTTGAITGLLSLLALDETPHPHHPHTPTGTLLNLTL
ncbi:acyltransferase domain-containing protein, partial [Streptomyces avermitilis]